MVTTPEQSSRPRPTERPSRDPARMSPGDILQLTEPPPDGRDLVISGGSVGASVPCVRELTHSLPSTLAGFAVSTSEIQSPTRLFPQEGPRIPSVSTTRPNSRRAGSAAIRLEESFLRRDEVVSSRRARSAARRRERRGLTRCESFRGPDETVARRRHHALCATMGAAPPMSWLPRDETTGEKDAGSSG